MSEGFPASHPKVCTGSFDFVSASRSASRPVIRTVFRSAINCLASSRPIPLVPPVMRIVLPVSFMIAPCKVGSSCELVCGAHSSTSPPATFGVLRRGRPICHYHVIALFWKEGTEKCNRYQKESDEVAMKIKDTQRAAL